MMAEHQKVYQRRRKRERERWLWLLRIFKCSVSEFFPVAARYEDQQQPAARRAKHLQKYQM
jgi:hypothetical protein